MHPCIEQALVTERDQEAAQISLASSSHQLALQALGNTASKQTSMRATERDQEADLIGQLLSVTKKWFRQA